MPELFHGQGYEGYDFHSVYVLLAVDAVKLQPLERPRLVMPLLDNIERHKVTLIQGPAGCGKSVLIEQLIQTLPRNTQSALLSLNAGRLAGGSIRASLLSLFAQFSSMGKSRSRFVIFIDDADELLKGETQALEQCLNSLPPQGRLVIASRRPLQTFHPVVSAALDQALHLNQMLFTLDELRAALTQAEKPMNAAALMTLWRFTEGWPAVVALLCASDPADSALDVQRLLQEWFEEELLSALEPGLLAFVLDASTVDPMQPALIDSMRGQPGSGQMLRKLASEHDVLVRDHACFPRPLLFILRSIHRRNAGHRVRELHRAALETLLDAKALEPALEHAFQMGDRRLLSGLLSQHDQALLRDGRMRSLARWLEVLDSESQLSQEPRLQLTLAWAKLFISDQDAAKRVIQQLRLGPMAVEQERNAKALELTWLSMRDHVEALSERAELWLEADSAEPFAQGMNNCTVALAHLVWGRLEQVEQSLEQGKIRNAGAFVDVYAASVKAMLCLLRGQPGAARDQVRQKLESPGGGLGLARRGNSLVAMLDALALYEMGRCDEVLTLLELHKPLLRQTGLLDQIILAYKLHARILMARGNSSQAQSTLASLECLGRAGKMERLVFCARLEGVRCALIRGDVALAREQLQVLHSDASVAFVRNFSFLPSDCDTWELMDARVRLAEGDVEQLPEHLAQALEQAQAAGRERRTLTLRILLAMAYEQRSNEHAALRIMEAALEFAESRDLIQAFRDEGRTALALALRASQGAVQRRDFVQRLVEGSGLKMPDCAGDTAANLTSKELQVLALLAGGQSNIALAEKLFVSESTVRTHLRSINAKLNARSRLEALAIARRDGLIAV